MQDGPEDLPVSRPLLLTVGLMYVLVSGAGFALGQYGQFPEGAPGSPMLLRLALAVIVDLGFALAFMWVLLFYFGRQGRFPQAMTAVLGTGTIFSALALPCMLAVLVARDLGEDSAAGGSLLLAATVGLIVLMLWSLGVLAHIISRTVASGYGMGVALAALSFFLNYQVFQLLVPGY